ncbi:hypothetical protein [Tumebacillus permanentifrigoris]|uniref:Uncharacterized protein n=1 Tax=Tumebacillus permanentifrigoris TaxID=378543 RepID=A0A316DFX9_9BACL|nr:hypothetical protein [Tumebacillus permanentifrigoris]PWK16518.1 hypothetical protein C7459_101384 [Tumebacillus permanentifrigoris]
MNKKTITILTSTLAVLLVASGGLALSSTNKVFAASTSADGMGCQAPDGKAKNNAGGKPAPAPAPAPSPATPSAPTNTTGTPSGTPSNPNGTSVVISGGYATDPQDKGRPVVLIAAALGVPTEVFREAFSGVTPAGLERGPSPEEAQRNKAALLKVLAPYGITNERLDEVSNFYRYNGQKSKTWQVTPASATAIVTNGVVTGVTITNPGAGYSSNPTVTVTGPNGTFTATATLSYSKDFKTNGSIASITINK